MKLFHAKRILKLAAFLRGMKKRQFNIGTWGRCDNEKCGTVACAAGWAAEMDEFINAGFRMGHMGPEFMPVQQRDVNYNKGNPWINIHGYTACQAFFGMSGDEVYVFHPNNYANDAREPSATHVAKKLEEIVKNNFPTLLPKAKPCPRKS